MNYKNKWNIEFDKMGVTYPNGKEALKNINIKINEGEFISIIGLSGAGKTTLLKTMNMINKITTGDLYVGDNSREGQLKYKAHLEELKNNPKEYKLAKNQKPFYRVKNLKGKNKRKYRTHIGMVFQRYNLIYRSTVLTNVLTAIMPKMPAWRAMLSLFTKEEKMKALNALADVNILETAYVRAGDLSGGQMQRVALARTIAQDARIILADEPVGALDPIMAKSVMDSFHQINTLMKRTTIMNLHHVELALEYTDRIIGVKDGEIVFDGLVEEIDLIVLKKIYGDQLSGFGKHELKEVWRKRKITKNKFAKLASNKKIPKVKNPVKKQKVVDKTKKGTSKLKTGKTKIKKEPTKIKKKISKKTTSKNKAKGKK